MIERRFRKLWDHLQAKKLHMPHFLSAVRLQGIRGIDDLRVTFDYPVSVVAGGNASGKSTVLFAAACAYRVPGAGVRDFTPSTLFPGYRPGPRLGGEALPGPAAGPRPGGGVPSRAPVGGRGRADERGAAVMEFDYSTPDGLTAMRWRCSKGWSRSFLGRRGAAQPERAVYLRTLGHVSQPVGVRGAPGRPHLNAARRETPLTSWQVELAQRMLPFRYSEVVDLSSDGRKLLFAVQEGGAAYSELHMAAGERAILRLSQEIAHVEGALVLIDDVEAGLHPWVQQLLMLHLQQLALQNDLQIVVTTHSPIVLDSVPSYGKIFLDRDDTGRVTVRRPYRDLVQDALYGRAGEALNLLCEDDAAEGVLQGVFDHLLTRQGVRREAVRIGRDTGADEFPMHAAAFRKFGRIGDFVFVVDGDKRGSDVEQRIGRAAEADVPVLFLPGGDAPEVWVWDRLLRRAAAAAPELGIDPDDLAERMRRLDAIYDSASDGPSKIAKVKLRGLSEPLGWDPPDVCRLRAAQARVGRREGGIVWHTQGSGKSLTMVWLAKWIRERVPNGRVLIVTDRTELDEQIEQVFQGVGERIRRTRSGADLVDALGTGGDWLVGSLVQKFGAAEEGDVDAFVADLRRHAPARFRAAGEVFVFVDECHRTQSGKLHAAMTELLPGAMLIGFTGTPLLKGDKQRSIETFGPWIHTYKYDEAVADRVVLDLRYEARDVDQRLTSQARVDRWFDLKTRGLTDVAKARLKQRWGTMRKVLSARGRLERIVDDVLLDMETRPRLKSGRGNALLVSDSIHSACRLFEMFDRTDPRGRCAVVTSYRPAVSDVKGEETGEGLTEKLRRYDAYRKMLAAHFDEPEDAAMRKVERFEQDVKRRFVEEPGRMKLLIVVDKLLTGFDAPSATCLYVDKPMRDHGLFQAICRVNRLDGDDKEYGEVVDYKDLFRSLERSIRDYTGEAFDGYDANDVKGLLKDRLRKGRERLEEVREQVKVLCEPVEPPRDTAAYVRFFCGAGGDAAGLAGNERKRVTLYALVASLLRAWADLAAEMPEAGYSAAEAREIRGEVDHYEKARTEVRLASGDYVDMKLYEPAMRHLLDAYVRADESERLSAFDDLTLVQLVVERGEKAVDALPGGIRRNRAAVAETIENNVRRVLVDEAAVNPKYYEKMSGLLDALIRQRRQEAIDYRSYLAKIVDLTRRIREPRDLYPPGVDSPARRALFDNLPVRRPEPAGASRARERRPRYGGEPDPGAASRTGGGRPPYGGEPGPPPPADPRAAAALALDEAVRRVRKADWRGNRIKEREVRNAVRRALGGDDALTERIFEIVKAQREY